VRVLFDHNLPHKLRTSLEGLTEHKIVTASYMGWGDLKNAELLQAAEVGGFGILVTGDQSLLYEQNLSGRQLAIVALSTNNWPIVKNYLPQFSPRLIAQSPVLFRQSTVANSAGRKLQASKVILALPPTSGRCPGYSNVNTTSVPPRFV
jgi:predicted nuclease of predicted toxin-antitoxin system